LFLFYRERSRHRIPGLLVPFLAVSYLLTSITGRNDQFQSNHINCILKSNAHTFWKFFLAFNPIETTSGAGGGYDGYEDPEVDELDNVRIVYGDENSIDKQFNFKLTK